MSTRWYLSESACPVPTVTASAGETWSQAASNTNRLLSPSHTAGSDRMEFSGPGDYLARRYVSPPIVGKVISGRVKSYMSVGWVSGDPPGSMLAIYIIKPDLSVRATLYGFTGFNAGDGTFPNSYPTGSNYAVVASGTALATATALTGDRIVVAIGATMRSDGGIATVMRSGSSSPSNPDVVTTVPSTLIGDTQFPWIEFTDDIVGMGDGILIALSAL